MTLAANLHIPSEFISSAPELDPGVKDDLVLRQNLHDEGIVAGQKILSVALVHFPICVLLGASGVLQVFFGLALLRGERAYGRSLPGLDASSTPPPSSANEYDRGQAIKS